MKKACVYILLTFIFTAGLLFSTQKTTPTNPAGNQNEKNPYHDIYQLYQQGDFTKTLSLIDEKIKNGDSSMRLIQLKFNCLNQLQRFDDALSLINQQIKIHGETDELLGAKSIALTNKGKIRDAINISIKKFKKSKKQSPWDCINIMHLNLQLNDENEALNWLQEAVNQGFISYRILEDPKYNSLNQHQRFFEIIETIKFSIGLGKPAKNFSTTLTSYQPFSLSSQKGNVILIHFWATWCEPCIGELYFLLEFYKEFQSQNFNIISISLDSDPNRLKDFIHTKNIPWLHSCSGKSWDDDIAKLYGINNLPSYWLIDKNGFLRSFDLKGLELRKAISNLLNEK